VDENGVIVVSSGDTVVLDVTIGTNPGVTSLYAVLTYNDEHLAVVGTEYTGPFKLDGGVDITTPGQIGLFSDLYANNTVVTTENVSILKVTFKVVEGFHGATKVGFDANFTYAFDENYDDVTIATTAANISAHPEYTITESAANCVDDGYTTYACACGVSHKIPGAEATGHLNVEDRPAKAATCDAPGLTAGKFCTDCQTWVEPQTELPALGHNIQDVDKVEPGCGTPGREAGRMCLVCGYVESGCEVIEAISEHKPVEVEAAVEPTCAKLGWTALIKCEFCGEELQAREAVDMIPHNPVAGEPVAPTCLDQGYTVYTCECGYTYTADFVAALGHNYGEGVVTEKTCTTDGYTTYTCEACGDKKMADFVAAPGHTFTTEVTAPT
jgi:hypothetical protein